MLSITISKNEFFNEQTSCFVVVPEHTITLEHSLLSISRWESKWNKAYLSKKPKTDRELLDYISCMSMNKEISMEALLSLTNEQLIQIHEYINSPMTATTFLEDNVKNSNKIITSEEIYSQMVALNIPFECQKWHFNRLMTLIRVCALHNQPAKKMSKSEIMNRNRRLNAERKAKYNTRG